MSLLHHLELKIKSKQEGIRNIPQEHGLQHICAPQNRTYIKSQNKRNGYGYKKDQKIESYRSSEYPAFQIIIPLIQIPYKTIFNKTDSCLFKQCCGRHVQHPDT